MTTKTTTPFKARFKTTVNPVACCAYLVAWDEDPGGSTYFMEVGGIADHSAFYDASIEAIKEGARETGQGLAFDLLPPELQDQMVEHVIIMMLARAMKKRDNDEVWRTLGILHAHIGKPLHFLVEFKIGEDGHHDPASVMIGANDYDTFEEAFAGYAKEQERVRNELHEKTEVYSEKRNGIPVNRLPDFDAVFGEQPPAAFGQRPNLFGQRTVLHRH